MNHTLATLPTPAAVVDLPRLKQNTAQMVQKAHRLGVNLRPHVKTHKCVEAAQYQIGDHFGGITVSTLAEAVFFAKAGFHDITFAVPLAPGRVAKACDVAEQVETFHVLVDHPSAVEALGTEASHRGQTMSVFIKIDCGYHRAGISPADKRLIPLARLIHAHPNLHFQGVLTHGGHSYDCKGLDAIRQVAEQERSLIVEAAERLRADGLPVHVVSVGSTPTMVAVEDLSGVTEMRPGNYALFDQTQADIGTCATTDIAISVITEVIGVYPDRNTLLIDAGALALSKDAGITEVNKGCFGSITHLSGEPIRGLRLTGLSQEHGKISGENVAMFAVGDRIRILPNHSCLVTALHAELHVEEDGQLVDTWCPARGW